MTPILFNLYFSTLWTLSSCLTFCPHPQRLQSFKSIPKPRSHPALHLSSNEETSSDDSDLFASLNQRRNELLQKTQALDTRWRYADMQSTIGLSVEDWIRRIDLWKWPLVALGSASGSIYVGDLETGEVLASIPGVHEPQGGDEGMLRYLYGGYDGGGVIDIALSDDGVILSAGREGGVKVHRIDTSASNQVLPLGEISALKNTLVSCIDIDRDSSNAWIGSYDKQTIYRMNLMSDTLPIPLKTPMEIPVKKPVLCVAACEEVGVVACGTTNGYVHIFSSKNGDKLYSWKAFNSFTRSVTILMNEDNSSGSASWSVISASGKGTLKIHWFTSSSTACVTADAQQDDLIISPLVETEMKPSHGAPVTCLTTIRRSSDKGGFLISGSQDGTMRVWDCFFVEADAVRNTYLPRVLYHLIGYKVWLGSVCADEERVRIVSDGCDNSILVHDFSGEDVE